MNQICVFDFDGVIANSIHDSYLTALNSYILFQKTNLLPLKKSIEPPHAIYSFEKSHPQLFRDFSQLMPLASRAEDYFVALQILEGEKQKTINTQEEFNQFKETLPIKILNQYHHFFYQVRHNMQNISPESWSKLLPPFPGIIEAIENLSYRFMLAIATSKDRISIDLQLNHYNLKSFFHPDYILDKDFAKSKRLHLVKLQQISKIPYHRIFFIDDKLSHLIATKSLGIKNYLATWGFNTKREYRLAQREGFPLLKLNALKNLGLNPSKN